MNKLKKITLTVATFLTVALLAGCNNTSNPSGGASVGLGPIPNPQSPIPNPQSPIPNIEKLKTNKKV